VPAQIPLLATSALEDDLTSPQLNWRFSVREVMLILAGVALILGIFVNWLKYPRVKLTIFNETANTIREVRVSFLSGERTAERIDPGGYAVTEIESGGDAGVFLSYLDSAGNLTKDEPLYYSADSGSLDRGYLEVHVTRSGTRTVKSIYTAIDMPIFTVRVPRKGRMTVK
jgi:hypothetical protein